MVKKKPTRIKDSKAMKRVPFYSLFSLLYGFLWISLTSFSFDLISGRRRLRILEVSETPCDFYLTTTIGKRMKEIFNNKVNRICRLFLMVVRKSRKNGYTEQIDKGRREERQRDCRTIHSQCARTTSNSVAVWTRKTKRHILRERGVSFESNHKEPLSQERPIRGFGWFWKGEWAGIIQKPPTSGTKSP